MLALSGDAKPTLAQIEHALAATQEVRQARTTTLKEHSHEQQRSELLDTTFHELTAFYLLPMADSEDITFSFSRNMPLAEKLNSAKVKATPKLVPYKDELLSEPAARGAMKWCFIGFYLMVALLVYYGMWSRSASYGLEDHVGAILTTGRFTYDEAFPLKRTYIGLKPIDDYLTFLSAVFMPGINDWDTSFGTLQMYFLGSLIQPIAVWTVEAFRKRNMLSPVAL